MNVIDFQQEFSKWQFLLWRKDN